MRFADDKDYLTYDDVLLVPSFSNIQTRKHIDITSGGLRLPLPFISSNMDTVTEENMVIAMHEAGGAGIIHRFLSPQRLDQIIKRIKNCGALPIVSVGVNNDSNDLISCALDNRCFAFCVDVAHGHHASVRDRVIELRERIRGVTHHTPIIIAGNVATPMGVLYLADAGADIIKVGIGPGSHCTTRIVTGHGVPQLTAVANCVDAAKTYIERRVEIIADGGIRNSGDIAKAFAAGADYVMLGKLLAGSTEAPGDISFDRQRGQNVKFYRGMASFSAQKSIGKDRAPEGVASVIPATGPVAATLSNLADGLRSALSYTGADNLGDFKRLARFIRVTNASHIEGTPHGQR